MDYLTIDQPDVDPDIILVSVERLTARLFVIITCTGLLFICVIAGYVSILYRAPQFILTLIIYIALNNFASIMYSMSLWRA